MFQVKRRSYKLDNLCIKNEKRKKKQTNNKLEKERKRILLLFVNSKKKMSLDLVVAWSKQFFDPEKVVKVRVCVCVCINMCSFIEVKNKEK